jgi:hypothetical protein
MAESRGGEVVLVRLAAQTRMQGVRLDDSSAGGAVSTCQPWTRAQGGSYGGGSGRTQGAAAGLMPRAWPEAGGGRGWRWGESMEGYKIRRYTSWRSFLQKKRHESVNLRCAQPDSGSYLSEIALTLLIDKISAHCKPATQYRRIFAISKINSCFSNFTL